MLVLKEALPSSLEDLSETRGRRKQGFQKDHQEPLQHGANSDQCSTAKVSLLQFQSQSQPLRSWPSDTLFKESNH